MSGEVITRTSCGYPEIQQLAQLLDMTPTDPTKVVRAAIRKLSGGEVEMTREQWFEYGRRYYKDDRA